MTKDSKNIISLYFRLQKCKACRLGSLPFNLGNQKLCGWGEKTEIIFVPMNPSSRRVILHKAELKPWSVFPNPPLGMKEQIGNLGMIYMKELKGWVARNDAPLLLALKELGIRREDVYITNLVKCCTEDNRLEYPRDADVIDSCKRLFLIKEFEILKPKIVIGLGKTFLKAFSLRYFGEIKKLKLLNGYEIFISTIHHPGYYLRQGILGKNKKEMLKKYTCEIASLINIVMEK